MFGARSTVSLHQQPLGSLPFLGWLILIGRDTNMDRFSTWCQCYLVGLSHNIFNSNKHYIFSRVWWKDHFSWERIKIPKVSFHGNWLTSLTGPEINPALSNPSIIKQTPFLLSIFDCVRARPCLDRICIYLAQQSLCLAVTCLLSRWFNKAHRQSKKKYNPKKVPK